MTRYEDGRLEREIERAYTRDLAEEMREARLDKMEREAEAIEREMDRRLERGECVTTSRYNRS